VKYVKKKIIDANIVKTLLRNMPKTMIIHLPYVYRTNLLINTGCFAISPLIGSTKIIIAPMIII